MSMSRPISGMQQCRGVNLISEKRHMIIGVPKEIKDHETRVGLVRSGVIALREAGHEVLVETHAGEGSSLADEEYAEAGAPVLGTRAGARPPPDLVGPGNA